jgi:hypothetical protein
MTCEFGKLQANETVLDQSLRDRLVCGLKSEHAQKRLLSEENLTLTKALQIAQSMEAAEANVKQIHGENVQVHSVSQPTSETVEAAKPRKYNFCGGKFSCSTF